MSVQADVTIGTLDPELCEGTWQDILEAFFEVVTITMPITLNTVNYGNTPPAADDQDKPWIRSTEAGYPDETYVYKEGQWLSKHPLPPGIVTMWMGTAADVITLDGGENTAVGADGFTGPFWEIVTDLSGKFPLGVSDDYALGATGGAKEVTLDSTEIPAHKHPPLTAGGSFGIYPGTLSPPGFAQLDYTYIPAAVDATTGDNTGGGQPHENMPPYEALYFIRRTNRLYRRV